MPLVQSIMAQYQVVQLDAKFEKSIDLLVEIDIRDEDVFTLTLVNKTGAKVEIKPKHMRSPF